MMGTWDEVFSLEDRFVVVATQYTNDVVDLDTGETYHSLTHEEAVLRASQANTMWHLRAPEHEIVDHLEVMEQRLRDKLKLPELENAAHLRLLMRREPKPIRMPAPAPNVPAPAVMERPIVPPMLTSTPAPVVNTSEPSAPAPAADPLAGIPAEVCATLQAYTERARLWEEARSLGDVMDQTKQVITNVEKADRLLRSADRSFRAAIAALYGPHAEAAITAYRERMRVSSSWSADDALRKDPASLAPLNAETTQTRLGRVRTAEVERLASAAAEAALDLRKAGTDHSRVLIRVRNHLDRKPALSVEEIPRECKRILTDAQTRYGAIRQGIADLAGAGTKARVQEALASLSPADRARVAARFPAVAALAQIGRTIQSTLNGPDTGR